MAEYTALAPLFTDIANAIRSKTGETGQITANQFPDRIRNISLGMIQSTLGRWEYKDSSTAIYAQGNFANVNKILAMGMSYYESNQNRLAICAILMRNEEIYSDEYEFNSNLYRLWLKHSFLTTDNLSLMYFDCQRKINNDWQSSYTTKMVMAIPIS